MSMLGCPCVTQTRAISGLTFPRVTTCLENLEMSGNYTDAREMSGISLKVRELSEKNLVMGNCPKTPVFNSITVAFFALYGVALLKIG